MANATKKPISAAQAAFATHIHEFQVAGSEAMDVDLEPPPASQIASRPTRKAKTKALEVKLWRQSSGRKGTAKRPLSPTPSAPGPVEKKRRSGRQSQSKSEAKTSAQDTIEGDTEVDEPISKQRPQALTRQPSKPRRSRRKPPSKSAGMSRKQKGKQRERNEDDIIVVESDPESSSENCTDDEQRRSSTDESEVTEHSENWEQENEAQTAEKRPRLKDTKAMLRQMKVAVPEWASDIETWSSDDDDTITNVARKGAKAAGSKITATVRKSAMIPDDEFERESTDTNEALGQEAKAPIPSQHRMAVFAARANTSVKPKETQAFQAPSSFQTNDAEVGRNSNDRAASSSMGAIKSQATKNNLKTHPRAQLSGNHKPSSKLKMSANSIDDTVPAQIVPNVTNENVSPPEEWPADTDIVFHPSGKVASVSSQTPTIHRLITEATTRQIPIALCWDYAFPAAGSVRHQVMRQVFVKAANELQLDFVKKRLELDSEYANFLAQSGRISNFRGTLKEKAALTVPHSYRIKNLKHAEQVALVNSLLAKDNYIYAYERGRFIEEKPYCNDGIIDIIHEAFFGTKPITRFRLALFSSSITEGPGLEEKELPASMVALATTTAFASLQELQNGFYNQIHFDSGIYAGYYLDHLATLNEIKRQNPDLYHKLMAYLFRVTSRSLPNEPMDPTGTLTGTANPRVKATIARMGDQLGAWADPVA